MEGVLWYLLASSRGGTSRVRILQTLADRPSNPNELATALDLDYSTVRHHLDILAKNNVVERTDDQYAAPYLVTGQVRDHWDVVERIFETVKGESS